VVTYRRPQTSPRRATQGDVFCSGLRPWEWEAAAKGGERQCYSLHSICINDESARASPVAAIRRTKCCCVEQWARASFPSPTISTSWCPPSFVFRQRRGRIAIRRITVSSVPTSPTPSGQRYRDGSGESIDIHNRLDG